MFLPQFTHRNQYPLIIWVCVISVEKWPGSGESGGVVASVDEWCEDGENQQADLRILHQSEGQQRLQEGRGQRRQQITAFITFWYLRQGGGTETDDDLDFT